MRSLRIDGDVTKAADRQTKIDTFNAYVIDMPHFHFFKSFFQSVFCVNSDFSVFAFLLTTQTGGVGITLTGADRVVICNEKFFCISCLHPPAL